MNDDNPWFIAPLVMYLMVVVVGQKGFVDGYIEYQLGEKEYDKRRKNMTLFEKFFFTRFLDIIPRHILYPYYFFLLAYPIMFFICIATYFFMPPQQAYVFREDLPTKLMVLNYCYDWIIMILFWTPGRMEGWKYERWYKKIPKDKKNKK